MNDRRKDPGNTPSLGALDELQFGSRSPPAASPRAAAPKRGLGWWWLLALVPVAVVALVLALWREDISERLIPASEFNREIEAAQLALARGELSRSDGSGARERFQAVLARDPDHPAARSGLAAVREAALVQARAALAAGDAATVRERLDLARAMAAPAAELEAIEAGLRERESADTAVADLLARARTAQAEGRLEQVPDGALALYQEVLALQPDNALALEGRRALLAGLLQQADAALSAGDVATAEALVARVVASDPTHLGLPAVQARLGEASAAREQAREQLLQAARTDLRAGRLDAAAAGFRQLLARDPGLVEARQGLDDAAAAVAARAMREAADFDFEAADASLASARSWAPESPAIAVAERRLADAMERRDGMPETGADPERLQALLDQARAAMRRGELIEPPGDSAWDRLRSAARIAPGDAGVRAAMQEYDRRARACFEDELASNRLSAAQACLDARAARERGGDDLAADRRRLADRWLAFADERLGASELALAARALEAARQVDPGHPGLSVFAERLRRAGGG